MLVQPDLGVGQVVVVDQYQIRPVLADKLAYLGLGAGDIQFDLARGAGEPPWSSDRSYRPIAMRCGRSSGCSAGASWTTAEGAEPALAI